MPADRRGKGRRTHQTPRQACRGPARPAYGKPPRGRPSRCAAAGRAARAGGRNASAGANSAAAARQARFSLNRRDRPHCGNGAFAGARIGGSLMRMRGVRPLKAGAPPFLPARGAAAQTGGFCFAGIFVCAKHTTAPPHTAGGRRPTRGGRPTAARRGGRRSFPRFSSARFPFLFRPFPRFSSARSAAARFPFLKNPARSIPAESADAFFGAFFYFSVDISAQTCYAKQQKRL